MLLDYSNRWSKNWKEPRRKVPLCPSPKQGRPVHPLVKTEGLSWLRFHKGHRPLYFVGSSHEDLKQFPEHVMRQIGYALWVAQSGGKSPNAKPFKGVGSGILEIVADYDGDTYRSVCTVRLASGVYVLHCLQKKSKHGIETPKKDYALSHSTW